MKGKTIRDFIAELYNNPEMEFYYDDEHYMVAGYVDVEGKTYTLDLWNISKNTSVFKHTDAIRENCIEKFESAQIFGGKTIYEIADEIRVEYG